MRNVTKARYSGSSILGILKEYPALKTKAYQCGDFNAMDMILDIDILINKAGLTPRQREAIELYYLQEYTQQEMADKMGVQRITARESLKDGEKKLKRLADKWGGN